VERGCKKGVGEPGDENARLKKDFAMVDNRRTLDD